ncbi:TRAP transporter small permease [Maridesulfovibrio hydrothermalis]|uniref:Putative Tripartite ATP-independent periplasmic transporters, DctQ component n=1 Tax=Maridesulfovibrio hydrothermalis AM13 = DSM 14728 TaxID=1121451 RepID=L0RBF7_9BACT|nr:TRAP transporter small permease [Maridesulfovibrio hydrothermalis]CCO23505.1 putative Tripartite ATP-independent periplasmic transporters, DctQ component [Maridesulfovibrio hydrothermalis AM13 = DSM 14728]
MIKYLEKTAIWICRILAGLAGIALTLMIVLACANMLSRAIWVPVKGTFELMGFLGAVTAALSLGFSQLNRSHIAVGLFFRFFPKPVQTFLEAVSGGVSCLFFSFCAIETAKWGMFLVELGEVSETLGIQFYPFVFAVAFGCAAMAFVLLLDIYRTLTGKEPLSPA